MKILHVLRAPIGGLFRHVCDLVKGQQALGHELGIICDSTTGGANAEAAIAKIATLCKLGVYRMPIAMLPSVGDFACISQTRKLARELGIDILHGHGAKGGLFARMAAKSTTIGAVYTPHGGSVHYNWSSPVGMLYLATERRLLKSTAGLAFVCEYEREIYNRKIGVSNVPVNVVHNGLWKDEFKPVPAAPDAADILFVGEMVNRKGVDLLISAIAQLKPEYRLTAAMIGDGGELDDYKAMANELGIGDQLTFHGRLGIAQSLPMGKLFVLPSRLESFPYVILEVIAAGRPTIATNVGGLDEVLPPQMLYEPDSVPALVEKLRDTMKNSQTYLNATQKLMREAPQKFGAESMVQSITAFYSKLK